MTNSSTIFFFILQICSEKLFEGACFAYTFVCVCVCVRVCNISYYLCCFIAFAYACICMRVRLHVFYTCILVLRNSFCVGSVIVYAHIVYIRVYVYICVYVCVRVCIGVFIFMLYIAMCLCTQ